MLRCAKCRRRRSSSEAKDRTRVIVNLTQLVAYDTRVEGNTLFVLVGADSAEGVPTPQRHAGAEVASSEPVASGSSRVESVDFRRGSEGEGRIVITLSNPKVPVDVTSESGRIKVVIRNTELPVDLRRRLDVTDFATPVEIVDAVQSGPDVSVTVAATGDWDYLAYQADQTLAIIVNPITPEELAVREDIFKFKGRSCRSTSRTSKCVRCHGTAHHLRHRLQPRRSQAHHPGRADKPGVAGLILAPIADANIDVDMIVQNVGHDGTTDFSFTVHRNEMKKALEVLDVVRSAIGARDIKGDEKIAKVSIVGVGMRTHAGVASKMFKALAPRTSTSR